MKSKQLAAALGIGLLGTTAAAFADNYSVWRFQDDSIDFIVRWDQQAQQYQQVTSGAVQLGDIFVGIFEMPSASAFLNGQNPGASLIPAGQELTGVSAVQLAATSTGGDPSNPGSGDWYFAPVTGGMNSIMALAGVNAPTVNGGNAGGGAVAAMWLNNRGANDPNVAGDRNMILDAADPTYGSTTNCTSLADCLDQASLGTLFQVDGLWGDDVTDRNDPNNFWLSEPSGLFGAGPITYDTVHGAAANTRAGTFTAALSNLYNVDEPVFWHHLFTENLCGVNGNPGYVNDGCVQVTITGDILGGTGLQNGAVARDDIDAHKLVVPEPATLGLLGLGLLGLGLSRRRKG
jgi:hypothetical protein